MFRHMKKEKGEKIKILDVLCDDVICEILFFLQFSDILIVQQVNKYIDMLIKKRVKRVLWIQKFGEIDEQLKNYVLSCLSANRCKFCAFFANVPGGIECKTNGDFCMDKHLEDWERACICKYYRCWNCHLLYICKSCGTSHLHYFVKICRGGCGDFCCGDGECRKRWENDKGYCPKCTKQK